MSKITIIIMVNICITIMLIEKKELIKYLVTSKEERKEKGTANRWEIQNRW